MDAAGGAVIPDGKYAFTTWTCGPAGGTTKDIKAFAATLQIQEVDETITGATGVIDTLYPAGCVRTVPITSVTYPSAGTVTVAAGGARTCAATCPSNQCSPGTEPTATATYSFTTSGVTSTFTRLLDAAFFTSVSLQSAAGCKAGDTETVVGTKQ
jgi:hypothetical protein